MNSHSTQTLADRLRRDTRTAGAPEALVRWEAYSLLSKIQDSEAAGESVEDSLLEEWIETTVLELQNDARLAAAGKYG